MTDRQTIPTGTSLGATFGYSRAVRVGNTVHVAGTTALHDGPGSIVGKGDIYAQAVSILERIEQALRQAGATLGDVVRTRIYITDMSRWQDVSRAHGEFFGSVRPAATLVEVSALIDPDALIEIEAYAVISSAE